MRLKFPEEICILTLENDAKFEEDLTCHFKIETTTWWILTWALECLQNLHLNGFLLTKVYNVWAKKLIEELCVMALKIDAKFEGKLSSAFQNDMRNLAKKIAEIDWKIAISFYKVKFQN